MMYILGYFFLIIPSIDLKKLRKNKSDFEFADLGIAVYERQTYGYYFLSINMFLLIEQIKTKQRRHYFCMTRYKKQH